MTCFARPHELLVSDIVYELLHQFCAFNRSIICRINICVESVEIHVFFHLIIRIFYFTNSMLTAENGSGCRGSPGNVLEIHSLVDDSVWLFCH